MSPVVTRRSGCKGKQMHSWKGGLPKQISHESHVTVLDMPGMGKVWPEGHMPLEILVVPFNLQCRKNKVQKSPPLLGGGVTQNCNVGFRVVLKIRSASQYLLGAVELDLPSSLALTAIDHVARDTWSCSLNTLPRLRKAAFLQQC